MKIIKVNYEEFGIEPKQANEIIGGLPQILNERSVLEAQFNEVLIMDIEHYETSKKARELRLLIQKNRTQGINAWHKTTKDYFLKGGQFVDAIKRKEVSINERMESDLEAIEKHQEIKEQKRLDELEAKRIEIAKELNEFLPFGVSFRLLSDDDFDKLIQGAKLQKQAKEESDKKAELERIEAERKAEEERKRIFEENERLKKEALQQQKKIEAERLRIEEERKAEEKKRALELAKIEAERKKEREEAERKQKQLDAENKRLQEIEEQRKADEIKRLEAERLEAERKQAEEEAKRLAPDIDKLTAWINSFSIDPIDVKDEKLKAVSEEIKMKFDSFKEWALRKI